MNKDELSKRNKELERWAERIRSVMRQAKDAGALIDADSNGPIVSNWRPNGKTFSIVLGDGDPDTDTFLIWENGDNKS